MKNAEPASMSPDFSPIPNKPRGRTNKLTRAQASSSPERKPSSTSAPLLTLQNPPDRPQPRMKYSPLEAFGYVSGEDSPVPSTTAGSVNLLSQNSTSEPVPPSISTTSADSLPSHPGEAMPATPARRFTPGRVREPPALIAVIGWVGGGKTTFVNNASGSRPSHSKKYDVGVSNEFELDGQRVVLIDTPGFGTRVRVGSNSENVMKSIKEFLTESYPTGTKLTGIIFVHKFGRVIGTSLKSLIGAMEELCEDSSLKNLVIMTHRWKKVTPYAEARLESDSSRPDGFVQAVVRRGAKIYRCTGASEPDLGALRIILGGRSVVPGVQQEPINKGSQLGQKAVRPVEPISKEGEVGELLRELEEQKWRAQQEADVFKNRIAELQSKEKSIRKELDEEKRRARKEADGFRKCIAELQSKLEEDRHTSACLPLDRSSPKFANRLDDALHGLEYEQWVQNFQEDDLVWFVDYLDKALDSLDPSDPASRKCLRELGTICTTHTTLPTSCKIPSHLLTVNPHPFASGGFGDVYRGTFDGSPVCVKRLRVTEDALPVATQMFCKEAAMWKSLRHSNILPLLGATISPPQLVSALMPAGDLSKYIPNNPNANRIGLLSEIAEGLRYLHSRSVIHGDLKGVNILVDVVDNIPHARIADFGITIVTKNLDSIRPPTRQEAHTPRWSAPEILREQNPTKESDVYSFAMVTIEVLTGQVPFSSEKTNWTVVEAVFRGDRPSRPEHPSCTDGLWALIQRCWDEDPGLRPEIPEVSQTFSSVSTD